MNASVRTSDPRRAAPAPRAIFNGRLLLLLCPVLTLQAVVHTDPQSFAASPQTGQGGSAGESIPAMPAKTRVSGTVKSEAGAALAGVRITLIDQRGSSPVTAITKEDGAYTLGSLPPGTYNVIAESPGFEKQSRSGVVVEGTRSVVVDFSLRREKVSEAKAANGQGADQSLGGFSYYDKPEYKAGSVDAASPPSGYSAAAEADSYDLILAYVQGENSTDSASEGQIPPSASASQPLPAAVEAGEAGTEGWNENQFFSHGSDLLLHGRFAPATAVFERAVTRYPGSAKLETGLGVALYAEGQYDQAVKALIRATGLMPSDPRPYLLLGRAYNASAAGSAEVIVRLRHLVEIEPGNAQAHYYYALSLWKGKQASPADWPQVEEHLKSAVALDPQFSGAHVELGALYAQQARYSQAIIEYQAAIRLKPNLARAHYRLAQAYLQTGDKAAAQAELDAYEKLRGAQPDTRP
jgi:tetratricopeptide (TPR) repeat protein